MDREAAEHLAKIAGIDVEQFAADMFAAGSNLKNKTEEEVFYQDFKNFSAGDITFGVGQITSLNATELSDMKERLLPYLEKAITEHGVDMIFFMLTNIIKESTELICIGNQAARTVENAFGVKMENNGFQLPGIVSRKKQLIPALVATMQE